MNERQQYQKPHKPNHNDKADYIKFIKKYFVYLIFNSNICTALEK